MQIPIIVILVILNAYNVRVILITVLHAYNLELINHFIITLDVMKIVLMDIMKIMTHIYANVLHNITTLNLYIAIHAIKPV